MLGVALFAPHGATVRKVPGKLRSGNLVVGQWRLDTEALGQQELRGEDFDLIRRGRNHGAAGAGAQNGRFADLGAVHAVHRRAVHGRAMVCSECIMPDTTHIDADALAVAVDVDCQGSADSRIERALGLFALVLRVRVHWYSPWNKKISDVADRAIVHEELCVSRD